MRICFLTNNLKQDNGGGVFSLRLIKAMEQSLGASVVALTSAPTDLDFDQGLLAPRKIMLIRNLWRIRRVLKSADVIHALDPFPYGVIAVIASLGLKKPFIITAIGSGAIIPLYQRFYRPFVAWTYRRADRVITISHFTDSEIKKVIPDMRTEVITLGVDANEFRQARERRDDIRQRSPYVPYLLSVGQLRARKGYHRAIRSYAAISARFPDLKYVIVGKKFSAPYYEKLKKMIVDLKLEDKVFIREDVNDRNDLKELYAGAELFCLLSLRTGHDVEGFGLVFLEAAAAGLPVIGTRGSGISDAMIDGQNGFLVDSEDDEGSARVFVRAVEKILTDKALHERMSAASLAFAHTSGWEAKMKQYVAVYKELKLAA